MARQCAAISGVAVSIFHFNLPDAPGKLKIAADEEN
jgi:hypothetical protein